MKTPAKDALTVVGPEDFASLRAENYGPRKTMPTAGEIVAHLAAARKSGESETMHKALNELGIIANTVLLWTKKGLYVQDNPLMKKGIPVVDEKKYASLIGMPKAKEVTFSKDKSVRFVPFGFLTGRQNAHALATNLAIRAIVGSEEHAHQLGEFARSFKIEPFFGVPEAFESEAYVVRFSLYEEYDESPSTSKPKVKQKGLYVEGNLAPELEYGCSLTSLTH